jgi:hypothetical protein
MALLHLFWGNMLVPHIIGDSRRSWFVIIQAGGGSSTQLSPGQQEHLREAFGIWQKKWPATRAATITLQQEMGRVRGNRHKQQLTINGNSNMGGGWQRYHLRAAVNDWWQK